MAMYTERKTVFSVILTDVKEKGLLEATVCSVLLQTFSDFEVVILSDNRKEKETLPKDRRIRFLTHISEKELSGEWIAFLKCGDLWDREKLKKQYESIEAFPFCPFFYTGSGFLDEKGKTLFYRLEVPLKLTKREITAGCIVPFSSVIIRKRVFAEYGLFYKGYDKWNTEFLFRMFKGNFTAMGIDEPLTFCRKTVSKYCSYTKQEKNKKARHKGISLFSKSSQNEFERQYIAVSNPMKRQHQLTLLEMLKTVDSVCKKNHIRYMLFAGTMLGAVRHKGFIPWDDDLDIIMPRKDYERFLQTAPDLLAGSGLFLQKEFSKHWPMFFSKVRKNGTTCVERDLLKDTERHMGVYIDIFPCDALFENRLLRKLQFLSSKVVIAKSLEQRGYLTDNRVKKLFLFFCHFLPKRPLIRFVQHQGGKHTKMVHTFFGASSKYEKSIYPREWITEKIMMPFEDGVYPVSKEYDALLKKLYGDYMTPPSEAERSCKVHGEIVDLEHSHEWYQDIHNKLKFKDFTRSIR